MKFCAFAAAALATLVVAQSTNDVPECARPCIEKAILDKTNCKLTDIKCICANKEKSEGPASQCVVKACGIGKAINEVLPATKKLCAKVPKKSS